MTSINIALGITENWIQYACVTITSVLLNRAKDDFYTFYILCNNSGSQVQEYLKIFDNVSNCEIKLIQMKEEWFEGAVHDWLGSSASYRLKLPSLTDAEKILYLDSDTIAVSNIAELYNIDISNYYLAAVEDKSSSMMKKRINLGENELFHNSGVQLINLDKYRKNNIEEQMFKKLRESTFYTDQDVMNDICRGNILSLPLKYNLMPVGEYSDMSAFFDALENPVILHYTVKPWVKSVFKGEIWQAYKKNFETAKLAGKFTDSLNT